MKLSDLFEAPDTPIQWVIASLGSNGLMLKTQGVTIKMNHIDTDALIAALKANDEVVVKTTDNKKFNFSPLGSGFIVTPMDDEDNRLPLAATDIKQILDLDDNQSTE